MKFDKILVSLKIEQIDLIIQSQSGDKEGQVFVYHWLRPKKMKFLFFE